MVATWVPAADSSSSGSTLQEMSKEFSRRRAISLRRSSGRQQPFLSGRVLNFVRERGALSSQACYCSVFHSRIVEHNLMTLRMTLVALVCALAGNVYAQEPLAAPASAPGRAGASAVTTANASAAALREDRVQSIVDQMRSRLGLVPSVRALPVSENSRVASIRRDSEQRNAFVLSIEEDFLDSLTDDELGAVAAHELGHVWIFTHHPFLQTEELANRSEEQTY